MPALRFKALVMISSYTSSTGTFITCCLLVQLVHRIVLYFRVLGNRALSYCTMAVPRPAACTNYARYAITHLAHIQNAKGFSCQLLVIS